MPDPTADALASIDAKLSAILALLVDRHLRDTDLAKPRSRSIDRMLTDVGLTGVQISRLLGKSQQAVSQSLARDGKGSAKSRSAGKKVAPTASAATSTDPAATADGSADPEAADGEG